MTLVPAAPAAELTDLAVSAPAQAPALPVGVVLNGRTLAEPCLLVAQKGRLLVRSDDLQLWGIDPGDAASETSIDGASFVALDGIVGLVARLDPPGQTLLVEADPALFPGVRLGRPASAVQVAEAVPAAFIDYDLSVAVWGGAIEASAYLDAGLSDDWGVLGTTAILQSGGPGAVRLDTAFQHDFPDRRLRLVLGDTVTRSSTWSRPVRYAGIRIASDFALDPEAVTYPLPVLSGDAAQLSTIELLAAAARQTYAVGPGPFAIDYQPQLDGAGAVTMTLRDLAGNQRRVTRSFYTSPRLLRPGLDDYLLEAGFLRRDYGRRSFAYGEAFVAGYWRRGATAWLTLEGRLDASGAARVGGLGLTFVLGSLGEFALSWAGSEGAGRRGLLYRAQFQRITPRYSLSASYQRAEAGFAQLGETARFTAARSELAVAGSLALGRFGSVNVSYVFADSGRADRTAIASFGYAVNLGRAYLSLGARGTDFAGQRSYGVSGALTLPFGSRSHAAVAFDDKRLTAMLDRSPPPDQGLGYRLAVGTDRASDAVWLDGTATLRTAAGELELSASQREGTGGVRLRARGALIAAGGTLIATPRLDYAFALVDVLSDAEVTLTLENRRVARGAGRSRRSVITGLQPYAANRIGIELDDLPLDTAISATEQRVVPGWRQMARVTFGEPPRHPATLHLTDASGSLLAAGLTVTIAGGAATVTGHDGEVYLADARGGELLVVSGAGLPCRARVPALPSDTALPRLGKVSCITENQGE